MESINTWAFIILITAVGIYLSSKNGGWRKSVFRFLYMYLLGVPVMIFYNKGDGVLRYLFLIMFMLGLYVLNKLMSERQMPK